MLTNTERYTLGTLSSKHTPSLLDKLDVSLSFKTSVSTTVKDFPKCVLVVKVRAAPFKKYKSTNRRKVELSVGVCQNTKGMFRTEREH